MDLLPDLREAMAEWSEPVTLPSGAVVQAVPGVASDRDALSGDSIVEGRTRTLRFITADIPGVIPGSTVIWQGKAWSILNCQLAAMGNLTRVFLGAPR